MALNADERKTTLSQPPMDTRPMTDSFKSHQSLYFNFKERKERKRGQKSSKSIQATHMSNH